MTGFVDFAHPLVFYKKLKKVKKPFLAFYRILDDGQSQKPNNPKSEMF